MNTTERIQRLDDPETLQVFQHLADGVFDAIDGADDILDAVPADLRDHEDFQALVGLATTDAGGTHLAAADAPAVARSVLLTLARNPDLEPAVAEALDAGGDGTLVADVILTTGLAASMLMCAATVGMDVEVGGVRLVKTTASPELVRSIFEGMASLVRALRGHPA